MKKENGRGGHDISDGRLHQMRSTAEERGQRQESRRCLWKSPAAITPALYAEIVMGDGAKENGKAVDQKEAVSCKRLRIRGGACFGERPDKGRPKQPNEGKHRERHGKEHRSLPPCLRIDEPLIGSKPEARRALQESARH